MKIISSTQLKELDKYTIAKEPIAFVTFSPSRSVSVQTPPWLPSPASSCNIWFTDGQKTDLMMVGKPSPNQTTINNLTENQTKGVSGEPPAPYGRYQNIFLSQTEYDELQAEYPDRLERFIEEMSRYLAASGKSYQNYAAALRIWAGNDKKGAPKKGIPDYSCKEGESL